MRSVQPWWGATELEVGGALGWQLGPLSLAVARDPMEWRVGWRSSEDPLDDRLIIAERLGSDALEEPARALALHRYAVRGGGTLQLSPLLADRPVVVRPELPLHVPAGQQATIFVSTPVWVHLQLDKMELTERETYRMSDTWFGPSTRIGELCYASRTNARLHLDRLPRPQARAVTEVRLFNKGSKTLTVERIKVPVPSLSLHYTPQGLWTQGLDVSWTAGGTTELGLGKPPARAMAKLAAPRRNEPLHAIARAFGAIIG